MSTEAKYQLTRQGVGTPAMNVVSKLVTFTVAGTGTLSDASVTLPAGSVFHSVTLDTPVAISGTPTTCNLRVGTAAAGQQIVADVDAKGQGHISTTIVAALDKVGGFSASDTPIYLQLVTTGGTAPAGNIYAIVNYGAPGF